jgi:hypothetical protein
MAANFIGGSAPAMANQVAEGYFLLNKNTLKGYTPGDMNALKQELEKIQRDVRALVPPQDDALANQSRNRKIARLAGAIQVIGGALLGRR